MPSATAAPASSRTNSLKSKLKTWEHQFKASEGRLPTKADIKANPEIAQMYQTYNNSRKGTRCSDDAPHHSTSRSIDHQVYRTPNRTQKTTRPQRSPPSASKPPSTTQTGVNSPRKLKKSVQDHSSPRKIHATHFSAKSQKSSIGIKHTPNQILDQSPFDFDSGGGKGSPNLFADLLLESAKDTPRTKARKFLSGVGSPLKASKLSNHENLSKLDDPTGAAGLASFLKTTTRTPEKPLTEKSALNRESGDDDDEVLGPSPFKPISNIFQPLFEDPFKDNPDRQKSIDSPAKSAISKWKKFASSTPFIPQPQSKETKTEGTLESAQRQPAQIEKRKTVGLGTKRKRVVLGAGEEQLSRFYKDLPDPSKLQTSSVSLLNKKKKVQSSSSNNQHPQTTKNPNQGNLPDQSNRTLHNRVKPIRLASHLSSDEDSGDQDEAELINKILDLPSGNPDHSAVYTELGTFKFTRPTEGGTKDEKRAQSGEATLTASKSDKAKGKTKIKADDTTKPIKLGTQKVLVRAYRPLEPNQLKDVDPSPVHLTNDNFQQTFEEIDDVDDNLSKEEEAEGSEGDSSQHSKFTGEAGQEDDSETEADLHISEELMNILNIDNDLTIEGEDRSHLLRELKRERKVKEILEGKRLTVFERTFSTRPPNNNPNIANTLKNPNNKLSKSRNPTKMTDPSKPASNQRSSSLYNTRKTLPSGSGSSYQYQENNEEDSLQFELGLDELQTQEIIESHIYGDDDDWEDEPSGWKKLEHLDNDGADD